MQRTTRGIRLKISPRPIALDGIAPSGDLPFKRYFGLGRRLGQVDDDVFAGRFHVADIDQSGYRRDPQARNRPTAGVQGEMIFAVVPSGRHHPTVLVVEVSLLWLRNRVLVPGVVLI